MNWLILGAPLVSAVLITIGLYKNKIASVSVSIAACAVSFTSALIVFFSGEYWGYSEYLWFQVGDLKVEIGAMHDDLARLMLLMATGVALLIHIFAYGYMKEDEALSRFFAKLSLFTFSVLGIVMANNLVMMFIFWVLVGLSSYLLIGFWFQRPAAAEASKKVFIINRLGDFGFLLGILGVWMLWDSIDFLTLKSAIKTNPNSTDTFGLTLVAIGLFCGCVSKSAQFPLHIWLPDATEGPTPVSALIHAATMVVAGVYMLCRVFFILELSENALLVIAIVGTVTALGAALIALQQNDIKRILAYSTLSQLGYMVAAVGMAASAEAMFHLTTHAFYMALLFLGAGSVIYGIHHEQDIWKMGGLCKKMPITFWTFVVATLALTGFPGLAGFYSKEAILSSAYHDHPIIFGVLLFTAGLTAFYMTRLVVVAFLGKEKSGVVSHARESSWYMTIPLIILSIFSVIGGWSINHLGLEDFLHVHQHEEGTISVIAMLIGVFVIGTVLAFVLYNNRESEPFDIPMVSPLFKNKFYSDEIYKLTFVKGHQMLATGLSWFDRWIIDGLIVRGLSVISNISGEALRLIQGGNLQAYIIFFVFGVAFIGFFLFRYAL
ncbi:MAG: NADH-quinone oxidoreductase subunit L [Verrucomicrobiota bacterium]